MGTLRMRYLVAYYSGATSQWRCLDTDLLPQRIDTAEDLPVALENAPMIALSWMLERRAFGSYHAAGAGETDAFVIVYELDPTARPPFGNSKDYVGPWLEIFMQMNEPIGAIALTAEKPMPEGAGINALRQLVTAPLQASDEPCQQIMDRLRDYAPSAVKHADVVPVPKKHETA